MDFKKKKRIVIFGGSFSPPHIGHVGDIKAALTFFSCDELWVMPSADRKDKIMSASARDRMAMTRLMVAGLSAAMRKSIRISCLEIDRSRPTRTYETLEELTLKYPKSLFYFLIGADSLLTIKQWFRGRELYRVGRFVVITRAGFRSGSRFPDNFIFLNDYKPTQRASAASSTMIRKRVRRGEPIAVWVSKKVAEYITAKRLYKRSESQRVTTPRPVLNKFKKSAARAARIKVH